MAIGQGLSYAVDVTMCIDKTGSMKDLLEKTKEDAQSIYQKFLDRMEAEDKQVDALRIKVIAFGDYKDDERPMMISKFFNLPDENAEFKAFLDGVTASGGGDAAENSLEALAHAIKNDWTDEGNLNRHVIMFFTDAPALKLGERADTSKDDEQLTMPKDLAELGEWWEEMDYRSKRLIIFAPNGYPWDDLSVAWNNCIHVPSKAGKGCEEVDIDEVVRVLVQSVGTVAEQ